MNFKGKVVWVSDVQNITTKDNKTFQKQEVVVETGDRYPQGLCFEIWDEQVKHATLEVGKEIEVEFNMTVSEYNGRHYNRAKAWKITPVGDK